MSDTPLPEAQPGFIDFDPPCGFLSTLPLLVYMNTATEAFFVAGNGAVLDECSNFGVWGYTPPNFLAWNSGAVNYDGSVPALPEVIAFTKHVSGVSMNIGRDFGQTGTAGLIALNASFNIIGVDTLTSTSTMQNLSVTAPNIRYAIIIGPATMIADDLTF